MNCVTLLLAAYLRFVTMWASDHPYNCCLGSNFIIDQLMLKMVLIWMLVQRVSGVALAQCYCQAEQDKRQQYDECVQEVQRGTVSPLIFPHLVEWIPQQMLFTNASLPYFQRRGVIPTVRCYIGSESTVMCLRGSRSIHHRKNLMDPSIDLACSENHIGLE